MTEVQLIIRFPQPLAEVVHKALAKSKESIDIKLNPEETNNKSNLGEPTRASVKFGDRTFPALIARLPCNIETHKTFDHVHYFKAGDIAEMVQIFETEEEREHVQYEMSQVKGYKRTFLSGITPPTTQIIRRKFLKTRSKKPKPKDVVSTVEEEIQKYTTSEEIVEEFEEVVDFEEYMADADHPHGHVFCFDSAALTPDTLVFQNHPEMLLQASDKEMLALIQEKEDKRVAEREGRGSAGDQANGGVGEGEQEKMAGNGGTGRGEIRNKEKGGDNQHAMEVDDNNGDDDNDDDDNNDEDDNNDDDVGSGGEGGASDSDSDSDDDDFLNDLESGIQSND